MKCADWRGGGVQIVLANKIWNPECERVDEVRVSFIIDATSKKCKRFIFLFPFESLLIEVETIFASDFAMHN